MSENHAPPIPRDLPATPDDARDRVDELDAKVEAEVRAAAQERSAAPDRAPESPAPEPAD